MTKKHERERCLRVLVVSVKRATEKGRRGQTADIGVGSNVGRARFYLGRVKAVGVAKLAND